MDYELVWTVRALSGFEDAVSYLATLDPGAADRLRADILASVGVLARLPHIGPPYERDRTGRTREIFCRPYRVFYRVDDAARRVEVLLVWHSSRREPPSWSPVAT